METLECTRCSGVKPISEFVRAGAKGTTKPTNTCSDCRNQAAKYYQKTKKRQLEVEENEDQEDLDVLELIDPTNLSDHIVQILNEHSEKFGNNIENAPLVHFQCEIDLSMFDKSGKEVAEELVELIEDMDEYSWMYESFIKFNVKVIIEFKTHKIKIFKFNYNYTMLQKLFRHRFLI